jgi:methyl-accepting chemotaxis protein
VARKSISLRKRISKMISWSNFISLLIMLIGIMIVFTGTAKMISKDISESLAVQVKSQIEHMINDDINKNKRGVSFFDSQAEMSKIGTPYALTSNMEETLHKKKKKTADWKDENNVTEKQELIIYYKIWKKEKLVYDSLKPKKAGPEGIIEREIFRPEIINKFSTASRVEILDKEEKTAGYVEVGLNPKLLYGGIMFILAAFVMLFIFILVLSQVLVRMFTGIIIKPLSELDKKMSVIAKGDIENAIRNEIKFKKPVIEIEKLVQAANEIISRMREYVNKLESL